MWQFNGVFIIFAMIAEPRVDENGQSTNTALSPTILIFCARATLAFAAPTICTIWANDQVI